MNDLNFTLPFIPTRTEKPRNQGVTMVMDKGLGLRETENFIEGSGHLTDIVKFGFGTSYVTKDFEAKIKLKLKLSVSFIKAPVSPFILLSPIVIGNNIY